MIQIGSRFTRLLVVKRSVRRDNRRERFWLCKCDCGKTKAVRAGHLREGKIKSCGCLREEALATWNKDKGTSERYAADLTGQRWNMLTAVERAAPPENSNLTHDYRRAMFWLWRCDCGNQKAIRVASVMAGRTRSCGCLIGTHAPDVTGQRWNMLTAVERMPPLPQDPWTPRWLWRCDCGKTKVIRYASVRIGKAKSCGCLRKGRPKK